MQNEQIKKQIHKDSLVLDEIGSNLLTGLGGYWYLTTAFRVGERFVYNFAGIDVDSWY
jgi:hypothetical protein